MIHFSALNHEKLLAVREIQPLNEDATAKKVYGIPAECLPSRNNLVWRTL